MVSNFYNAIPVKIDFKCFTTIHLYYNYSAGTASPRFSIKDFRNSPGMVGINNFLFEIHEKKINWEHLKLRNGGVKGPGDINLGPVTDFNCPSDKTIAANPNDCAQYYTCYIAEPVYLWQCVNDYRFDLTYDGCNFPQNVQCGSRPINPLSKSHNNITRLFKIT